ncbi:hypothetical protein LOK49_LG05G01331 [Camellia lanceoleosa]|uniref:Uncharacterized protein n=1 Tax=Camellia lanceoleosa TaxID=1840588 RepID=A0ACC0HRL2_9ERIC|nr:hypothetical protein LOK49_LG05G01331 [Camellia lanceoleosa]
MALPDGMGRINIGATSKTPKARTSPTFEQLLQGKSCVLIKKKKEQWDTTRWPSCSSPILGRDHDHEEYYSPSYSPHILHSNNMNLNNNNNNKKSVLMKVKEKAKKLRQSLSKKKHDGHEDNSTPSWGVSLDDDEDDEDPEYLGAPMYESELAPETYKEKARQHPRADPVVSGKHILTSTTKNEVEVEVEREKQKENVNEKEQAKEEEQAKEKEKVKEKEKPISPTNKTITETMTEKLTPAYNTVADATHTIASKIAGLTVSTTNETGTVGVCPGSSGIQNLGRVSESRETVTGGGLQMWDKGVSVKEYLMQKLEPGEDDRALSQAITDAISPRKTRGELGVVEKVKGAVNLLLRNEESSQSTVRAANLTSSIPVSTNAQPVIEEENHGRILQAN